jgi:hypothetical protein
VPFDLGQSIVSPVSGEQLVASVATEYDLVAFRMDRLEDRE